MAGTTDGRPFATGPKGGGQLLCPSPVMPIAEVDQVLALC